MGSCQLEPWCKWSKQTICGRTYILVWNNLDTLHVASGLKNLLQDILRDSWIQTSHVQGPLVWLGCRSTYIPAGVRRRHHVSRHRRRDCCRNRVGILWNHHGRQRWWWHVGWILAIPLRGIKLRLTRGARGGLERRRKGRRGGCGRVLSHSATSWQTTNLSKAQRYPALSLEARKPNRM
jgi:hypothetical protein